MNIEALRVDGESAGALCNLKWPPVQDSPERVLHLAWPLLRRPGAFLVALPASLLEDVSLYSASETSTVVGPFGTLSVPAVEEGDTGEDALAGFDLSVLLVDLEESFLAVMSPSDLVTESGLVVGYEPSAPQVLPSPEELMKAALTWVGSDQAPGLAYVTAQEESDGVPEPPGKKVTKAKRITTAQLAEQVNQLASVLPNLVEQVRLVSERQAAQAQAPPAPAGPAHQRNFPPVGHDANNGAQALSSLAAALPAPARLGATAKAPALTPVQPPVVDPKSSALPSSSDPLATAIAQQGQALSLLVSHLASLDLSTATVNLGSKGSAKRESARMPSAAFSLQQPSRLPSRTSKPMAASVS